MAGGVTVPVKEMIINMTSIASSERGTIDQANLMSIKSRERLLWAKSLSN